MIELAQGEFRRAAHIFGGHLQYIPALSVIHGEFPGRVFVDDRDSPAAAVVWAFGRWAYIEGRSDNTDFNSSIARLVQDGIMPPSREINLQWFEMYTSLSPEWNAIVESALSQFGCKHHLESTFVCDRNRYRKFRASYKFPKEVDIWYADIPVLPDSAADSSYISDDHKTCTAPGFRVLRNDKIIAQCRSNGLSYGSKFMVDVETFDKNERCKGYATAVSVALMDYCIEHDLEPLWEAMKENTASRRLAQKLGFVEDESYPVYMMEF
jgi:RimJ/RimL family protein N-acetyltransferase